MRTVATLSIVGVLVASLAACSAADGNPPTGDCKSTPSGSVSDSVSVTGEFGSAPTVEFAEPLSVDETQRTVVIDGDGSDTFAQIDDDVSLHFSLFNGTTGEPLSNSYDQGGEATFTVNEELYLAGLVKTIACAQVGQRIVGVVPPGDAFGAEGSTSLPVAGGESIVFVVDIVSVEPPLEPEDYSSSEGFPEVTLSDTAEPVVTIPDAEPTEDLRIAIIEKGDGDIVGATDSVSVLYYGVNWQTGEVFDKAWDAAAPATFSLQQVVPGFAKAIAGRSVGSTVIAVIPPALGYGPAGGSGDGAIGAEDTIVFVITIVAVTAATE